MKRFEIIVIDDDSAQAALLGEYLHKEGFSVTIEGFGRTGLQRCLDGAFDAAVLDIMLPDINGIEVLRQLRATSDLPVIVLTAKGDGIDRVIGLEVGADDYMAKPCLPRELLARLRAILRRTGSRVHIEHGDARPLAALELRLSSRQALWQGQEITLTATEFSLLHVLAQAHPSVATKEELSLNVLARRWQPYDRSLDVHASHVRQKLRMTTRDGVELVTVRGIGYRLKVVNGRG